MAQAPQPSNKPAPHTPSPKPNPSHAPTPQPHKNDDKGPHGTKPSEDQQGAQKDRHPTPHDDKLHAQGEFKDQHVPLRDPAEGKAPAVIGRDVARQGEDDRDLGPGGPRPMGVKGALIDDGERDPDTVAEEQRLRSADIEAMGVEAYKDSIDERTDEEKNEHKTVLPPPQRYGSDDEGRQRQIEGDNLARRS